jgi:hypothetical protein
MVRIKVSEIVTNRIRKIVQLGSDLAQTAIIIPSRTLQNPRYFC